MRHGSPGTPASADRRRARAVMGAALALCSLSALVVAACGGTAASDVASMADSGADAAPPSDATPDTRYEHVYPAPHAPLPLVGQRVPDRASVQVQQQLVTVAFAGDPMRARLEAFTDALGTSDWWSTTTGEYCVGSGIGACVGPSTVLAHVTLPGPAPASLSAAGVEGFLQQLITDGVVPRPESSVVYTLFFPASVQLGEPGFTSCSAFDGYHSAMRALVPPLPGPADTDAGPDASDDAGDGGDAGAPIEAGASGSDAGAAVVTKVPYAVLARCSTSEGEATLTAAHELIEVATDPDGFGFNMGDAAWSAFFYPEIGDLCDFEPTTLASGFAVPRGWSNAAALAGKNPCVPGAPGEIYFNAAPEHALVLLAVGATTTIPVMPYSEAETEDWTLAALDVSSLLGGPPTLDVSLDRTSVHNGLPATLTVTLLRRPDPLPTGQRAAVVALSSSRGATQRYWPMLIVPR